MTNTDHHSNLTVKEALSRVLNHTRITPPGEIIPVHDSLFRITSEPVTAKRDIPRFDNSAMDGFIFHSEDLAKGITTFPVTNEIRPESSLPDPLEPGSCMRIMTGAPIPDGDYFVIPVEEIRERTGEIEILNIPDRNPIRRQGEGYRTGKIVLEKGAWIRPYELGLLVESGNKTCMVQKKIRIAVQVTGSEVNEDMDSNGPVLESLISMWPGVKVSRVGVLEDNLPKVTERMEELKKSADLVITTGGISAGRHDYVLQAMKTLGASVIVRKVNQKPGKPFTVTLLDGSLFFHLPGNPVSAVFTAEYYVRKFIMKQQGFEPLHLKAVTETGLRNHRNDKSLFLPARLKMTEGVQLSVRAENAMHSHLMELFTGNNAYIELGPETSCQAGDRVEVIPFTTATLYQNIISPI